MNSSPIDIAMQWRVRAASDTPRLVSDVLNLTGMSSSPGGHEQTDPFVLQMSYDVNALNGSEQTLAASGLIDLAWLDKSMNQPNGIWEDATLGNFGTGIPGDIFQNVQSSWDAFASAHSITNVNVGDFLGSYGVDTVNHEVWAVVNHNSPFAVVPEPSSWLLFAMGAALFCGTSVWRRRQGRV